MLTPQFIRFSLVGVLNTLIDLGLFRLLTLLGLDPLVANLLSFSAGAANSFLLNKYWTFGVGGGRRETATQATKFAVVTLLVLSIHEGLIFVLHTRLEVPAMLVKLLAIGVGLVVGFGANKLWTFSPPPQPAGDADRLQDPR